MDTLEIKIQKLKERFPAAERHALEYAARASSKFEAMEYLKNLYGNPTGQPSAWAKPLPISATAKTQALSRALETELKKPDFLLDTFKTKECKNRSGCNCDNYHHEFEKRRNPNRIRYSEIPCPNVFKGSWKAPIMCSKGDSCGHSHTVNEASYHPRTFKTKKCMKYEEGNCHYGMRCAYVHGRDDPVAADWRRQQEEKSRPKISTPVDFTPKVSLSSLIKFKEVESNLSPAAWSFTPSVDNQMQELNLKMQKRIEELYLKTLCSICYINEKNTVLVPCGHLFCSSCIEQTITAVCPICRRDFKDKLPIFL
jgi:Zinc finger, C3HC4 type (RING finger)